MAKTTHQIAGGEAPGWAHCGAWIAPGQGSTAPTCPRCAAAAARIEATTPRGSCATCSGGGCPDCTDH